MPTTVNIPPALLRSVDRAARRRKVTRNRFIVLALENELSQRTLRGAAPRFRALVRRKAKDPGYVDSVRRLFESIESDRKSAKRRVKL